MLLFSYPFRQTQVLLLLVQLFVPLGTVYFLVYFLHPPLFPEDVKMTIRDSGTPDLCYNWFKQGLQHVTFLRRHIHQSHSLAHGRYTRAELGLPGLQFIAAGTISAKASREKCAPECPLLHLSSRFYFQIRSTEVPELYYSFSGSS